jgi:hypothetical protein
MIKKILIDLDTLLDTRLATLGALSTEALNYVVKHDAYWQREHTDWSVLTNGLVTNEQFAERYRNRDDAILRTSTMTAIMTVLLQILAEIDANAIDGMHETDVGVEVNLAPYSPTHEEVEELQTILRMHYGQETIITFCNIPLKELTPAVLRERYSAVIMYGFHEWIVEHDVALMQARTPCFNFIGPKLFEKDPSRLTVEQKQEEFLRLKLFKLEFMDFEFVDARFMSMFRPERLKVD